jgi:hypothetical protein
MFRLRESFRVGLHWKSEASPLDNVEYGALLLDDYYETKPWKDVGSAKRNNNRRQKETHPYYSELPNGIDREHVSLCYASVVFQLLVTLEKVEIHNSACKCPQGESPSASDFSHKIAHRV